MANVGRFFEIVRRQGALLRDDRLPFLVAQLDTLIETGDDPSTADVEPDEGDAVHVLTYHKAKGLEFNVVHMVGLVADRFPGWDRRDPLEMPDELVRDAPPVDADHHTAEERRLFYVGMTRAREELVMSWAQDYGGRRSRAVSQFVSEALDLHPGHAARGREAGRRRAARPSRGLAARSRSPRRRPARSAIDRCSCRYGQIQRLPRLPGALSLRARRPHSDSGLAPDGVRPRAPRGRAGSSTAARSPVAASTAEELHAALDANWESVGFLTREHEEARRAAAHEAVARFWEDQQRDPAQPIAVERDFTVSFGPDRLRGRYDRIDRDDAGRTVITDYKSSDVRDLATANKRARESLQLSIYALAHEAESGALPDELALHFLETGLVGRSAPTEKRLARGAGEDRRRGGRGIRAGRFDATPSAMRCGYCPFREICPDATR